MRILDAIRLENLGWRQKRQFQESSNNGVPIMWGKAYSTESLFGNKESGCFHMLMVSLLSFPASLIFWISNAPNNAPAVKNMACEPGVVAVEYMAASVAGSAKVVVDASM